MDSALVLDLKWNLEQLIHVTFLETYANNSQLFTPLGSVVPRGLSSPTWKAAKHCSVFCSVFSRLMWDDYLSFRFDSLPQVYLWSKRHQPVL